MNDSLKFESIEELFDYIRSTSLYQHMPTDIDDVVNAIMAADERDDTGLVYGCRVPQKYTYICNLLVTYAWQSLQPPYFSDNGYSLLEEEIAALKARDYQYYDYRYNIKDMFCLFRKSYAYECLKEEADRLEELMIVAETAEGELYEFIDRQKEYLLHWLFRIQIMGDQQQESEWWEARKDDLSCFSDLSFYQNLMVQQEDAKRRGVDTYIEDVFEREMRLDDFVDEKLPSVGDMYQQAERDWRPVIEKSVWRREYGNNAKVFYLNEGVGFDKCIVNDINIFT